jgi:hypothetical protein
MKNLKWVLAAAFLAGLLAYLLWPETIPSKQALHETPLEKKQKEQQQEKEDIEGFSQNSFSPEPHEPTGLEKVIILRDISPEAQTKYLSSPPQEEAAALVLATIFLQEGQTDAYRQLAKQWKPQAAWPAAWFVLDGDALAADDKKEEAITHLASQTFSGLADAARLGRIALLEENNDDAATALQQARQEDPLNPLLFVLTARVLEKKNRIALLPFQHGKRRLSFLWMLLPKPFFGNVLLPLQPPPAS